MQRRIQKLMTSTARKYVTTAAAYVINSNDTILRLNWMAFACILCYRPPECWKRDTEAIWACRACMYMYMSVSRSASDEHDRYINMDYIYKINRVIKIRQNFDASYANALTPIHRPDMRASQWLHCSARYRRADTELALTRVKSYCRKKEQKQNVGDVDVEDD